MAVADFTTAFGSRGLSGGPAPTAANVFNYRLPTIVSRSRLVFLITKMCFCWKSDDPAGRITGVSDAGFTVGGKACVLLMLWLAEMLVVQKLW